ncbi:MAG: hypothetical protein R2766_05500 [Saprospiraceae bacterium]
MINILHHGIILVKNYIHIVFSTKYRQPLIHPVDDRELYGYLGQVCSNLDCPVLKVGGYVDPRPHTLLLSKNLTLAKLLK